MTKLFRVLVSVLLLAACDNSRPEDKLPAWGEPCGADGLCDSGLACNTGDGLVVGGHCSDACKTVDDCDQGQICSDEGACVVSCKADHECLFAAGGGALHCIDDRCV